MNQCGVCGQQAIQARPFEILPNNALAMEAIHNDNLKHTWTEYKSQEDLGRRTEAQPIRIKCPECGKIGRVGSYREDSTRQEFVTYYIKHGKGQTNKGTHYIRDPIQRKRLLTKLGRYIDPKAIEGNGNGKTEPLEARQITIAQSIQQIKRGPARLPKIKLLEPDTKTKTTLLKITKSLETLCLELKNEERKGGEPFKYIKYTRKA